MDESILEFKDRFSNQPILNAETLKDVVYHLNNQLQIALDVVEPFNYKEMIKE